MTHLHDMGKSHVTIAMPVYNGADRVARAIVSVKDQTFQDWRLLIVDNASTDRTLDIARHVGTDSRIEIVSYPDHVPALSNFRRALSMCDSPYACFLAHDDYWDSNFLTELVGGVTKSSGIAGACPRVILFSEFDRMTVRIQTRRWRNQSIVDRRGLISLHSKQVNAWYGLYRTAYLKKVWEAIDPLVSDRNPASDRAYVAALLTQPVIYCNEAVLFKAVATGRTRITPRDHRESNRQVYRALRLHRRTPIGTAALRAEFLGNEGLALLRGSVLGALKLLRRRRQS